MAKGSSGGNTITIWFIVGFLVVVTIGVIVAAIVSGGVSPTTPSSTFQATTVPPISSTDWTQGSPTAKVSLIEYGDYECPACGAYYPIVKQLLSDYGNQVYFAFRNFPLYTIHPDAGIASQAAEAAGLQGKFWQMHDLLYTNQSTWSIVSPSVVVAQYFDGYATSLGMNVAKFDSDMNSSAVMNKIQADVNSGTTAQIDHTPTFFVNNTQIENPTSYDDFKSVLDAALGSTSSTIASSSGVSVSVSGASSTSGLTVTSTPLY
jgi:protein-disulfide isomerase